jgi:hypothetical protein
MKPTYHMDLGDTKGQGFPDNADDFLNGILKGMGIAFLGGESAKLAGKYADVGVVDVAVMNVTGVIPVLSFAHDVRHHPEGVQVARLIQSKCFGIVDTLLRFNFLCNGPKRVGN